ncbi:ABC transporter permease [Guggenheimella bovis]
MELEIWRFLLIYLLLIFVVYVMKKASIDKTKVLFLSSFKMTVQLVLAGIILTYIFKNPHPLFTFSYVLVMIVFSVHRVLKDHKDLSVRFKRVIGLSIGVSSIVILIYFVVLVIGERITNPQYVIPLSGMLMGNSMTSVSLGIKTFRESLEGQRARIQALLAVGADPKVILHPFLKRSLETAILPTINSMVGMGIVSLPGMMTGQILAGAVPNTAILYQIAIMIAISASVSLACFGSLYFGLKTLYDKETMII